MQHSMSTSTGVMVKAYGSPAVRVMGTVSATTLSVSQHCLPTPVASTHDIPARVPEVSTAVAVPPEVHVPERKAST